MCTNIFNIKYDLTSYKIILQHNMPKNLAELNKERMKCQLKNKQFNIYIPPKLLAGLQSAEPMQNKPA